MSAKPADGKLVSLINNALHHFISGPEMFTAFDVTRKLRQDEPTLHIFHSVVKEYVHSQYDTGKFHPAYSKVLVPIGDPEPWLYYVPGYHDTAKYVANVKNKIVNSPSKPPTPSASPKPVVAKFVGIRG